MVAIESLTSEGQAILEARIDLMPGPTPLELLPRFSEAIGAEIWVKRDDVGSLGLVGNKVRKLEYLLADAVRQGASVLVTVGAAQSNHARATASAAAKLGLRCVLILSETSTAPPSGNHLLDLLFGAEVEFVDGASWDLLDATLAERCNELERGGERPYAIPMGGSTPLGALGLARGYLELGAQLAAQDVSAEAVIHASSSGGTQAGLELGRALVGRGPAIRGIAVAKSPGILEDDVAAIATGAAALVGLPRSWSAEEVILDYAQVGPGYGLPTPAGEAAIRLLAHTEGILTDPVYSGKGLAGLIDQVHRGLLHGPVVFWHTGGTPALFDPIHGAALLEAPGSG